MGWFDRFRKRDEPEEVTPPIDDVLLRALLDGETITREKALTLPAVSGAVDFICNCVACMPVKLYKYKQGKVAEVEDDPRTKLLNGDTGDTLDAFQMKKAMVADYLLGKGGYAYIRRFRNEVTGLFYVQEQYITIMKVFDPIYKNYEILVEGRNYKPYEFIKLLRNTTDGASGQGLTVEVSKALETAYQTLIYQLSLVKSGGNKKGFLKAQRKLGQDEIDILKKAWKNLYANNEDNVVVLNNGLEFQEASNSSVEMQLNESKHTLQDEINNLFHISSNFDMTFKMAIYPIIKAFETALNRDLLLEKEKKNYYFEFDVKEIVKADLNARYNAYKTAKETGFLTLNEIRKAENLNYIEGMDVVNVGLGAVLYDINTQQFYTPNTGETQNMGETDQEIDQMLEDHEMVEEYDESGNSAERSEKKTRFNPNHDPKTGRFGSSNGSGGSTEQINQLVDGHITMTYVKVTGQNTANYGDLYGQNLEPSGEYMSMDTMQGKNKIDGFEYGTIRFDNPLILEHKNTGATGWKKDLSDRYGGKTGKKLSNAIMKDGYDAVMTKDGDDFVEIVNLSGSKRSIEQRFNPNHDAKTGRFSSKGGSGIGVGQTVDFKNSKGQTTEFRRVDGAEFQKALKDAKQTQPADKLWRVDDESHDAKDYDNMKCFVTDQGSTVAVTGDGDIISVCKNAGSSDSARSLMEFAVEQGGTKLDSYDGNYEFYSRMGFEPVSWTPFVEGYNDQWRKGVDAPEPIVFFHHTGNSVPKNEFYSNTPASKDYDEAQNARDKVIKK